MMRRVKKKVCLNLATVLTTAYELFLVSTTLHALSQRPIVPRAERFIQQCERAEGWGRAVATDAVSTEWTQVYRKWEGSGASIHTHTGALLPAAAVYAYSLSPLLQKKKEKKDLSCCYCCRRADVRSV